MSDYVAELTTVVEARNDIYAYANRGAIATFDWTTTRDEELPDLYTLTAVYENSFGRQRKNDFTANAALRVYRDAPSGGDRRMKDFSLAAQWDRPLGRVFEIPFILSASGEVSVHSRGHRRACGAADCARDSGSDRATGPRRRWRSRRKGT